MTKQVSIAGGALRINETELAVLRLVAARAAGPTEAVQLRLSELCRATGVTEVATRRALRSLESRGLMATEERFDADGGQRASSYRLTTMGALAVAAAPRPQGAPAEAFWGG